MALMCKLTPSFKTDWIWKMNNLLNFL
jgi:hypothetical protein